MSFWSDRGVWKKSAVNTAWCLAGCAIGDFGTILYFQFFSPATPVLIVFSLAIANGLLTSILLETIILRYGGMRLADAFKTAIGMSFISMVMMEIAMNATDFLLTGGARLTWWVLPPALLAGFVAPWPYNYWRLKKYNRSCH